MNLTEIIVVIVGLAAGYWMVSNFIDGKRQQQARTEQRETPRPAATPFRQREPRWYDVLRVSPNATQEEIRRAYQRQMSLYHPDKVATMGEEIRNVAEKKAKEIGAAYEEAQRLGSGR